MSVSRVRAVALAAGIAVMLGLLWWCGRALEAPPVAGWQRASTWYERLGPAAAAAWCVRTVALALGAWLFVATVLEVVASRRTAPRARVLADLIAPRSLQRLVHGLAGLSLTAGLLPAPSAGMFDGARPGVAVLRLVDEPSGGPEVEPGTATLRLEPETPPTPPRIAEAAAAPTLEPPLERVVEVHPGDSLWSLAVAALTASGAEAPPEAEVARYWGRLIELNRHRLVVPDNPDLIYPGQVLTLPEP
ncbi:MAG: LysM peptidoglycan-binding domain-containing protein [Microthrixaceae bacterium]